MLITEQAYLSEVAAKEGFRLGSFDYNVDRQAAWLGGLKRNYKIIWISDMHIIFQTEEVAADCREAIDERIRAFTDTRGLRTPENWLELAGRLDSMGGDLIVLGGDMMDFCSERNIACLREGLAKIKTPVMYIRGDHDNSPYYLDKTTYGECRERHNAIGNNANIIMHEFDEFIVLGFNDSTRQLTEAGLAEAKRIFDMGKPIILMMHVPIKSLVEDRLAEESLKTHGNRVLLWGEGNYYNPNETTAEFLKMVLDEDSPVVSVFAGHMHSSCTEMLNGKISQHVFSYAAADFIGEITVG